MTKVEWDRSRPTHELTKSGCCSESTDPLKKPAPGHSLQMKGSFLTWRSQDSQTRRLWCLTHSGSAPFLQHESLSMTGVDGREWGGNEEKKLVQPQGPPQDSSEAPSPIPPLIWVSPTFPVSAWLWHRHQPCTQHTGCVGCAAPTLLAVLDSLAAPSLCPRDESQVPPELWPFPRPPPCLPSP